MREHQRFPLILKQGASGKQLGIVRIIWGGFSMYIVGIDVAKRSYEAIVIDDSAAPFTRHLTSKMTPTDSASCFLYWILSAQIPLTL